MEVIEQRIIYKHKADEFHLYPIGDEHLGTKHCAENRLMAKHKEINLDPLALWIGMGDKCEFITPSDPRWDSGVIADWCDADNIGVDQVERYVGITQSNAKKCLGLINGNHEDAIKKHSHINVQKNCCDALGVPDLRDMAYIKLVFERYRSAERFQVIILATHGSGGAITKGAKMNRLQRLMDNFEADIVFHAHMHDIITDTKPYMTLNAKGEIKQKVRVGAVTGCWFRTYTQGVPSSYGEKKNYPPTMLGCPVVNIRPHLREIEVQGN